MSNKKETFWNILKKNQKIAIPIIQRDYVHGREDSKTKVIRKDILKDLYKSLNEDKPLDFDFIYGSEENNTITLLDGQQRLTTLFLLHWYLAVKDGEVESMKQVLKNFTYQTRVSSRDFCDNLINKPIEIKDQAKSISGVIKDQPWFFLVWEKDPTISAMLVMLDSIHVQFFKSDGFFKKLTDPINPIVTFYFLPITDFGLSDALYIKMNARGKLLTEFEGFKAKFEQFLEKKNPSGKKEFAKKIDGVWTDFFWKYKENYLIDEPFMRFFAFVTEMLYYQNKKENDLDENGYPEDLPFEFIEQIYSKEENLNFLFASLDVLSKVKDTSLFFKSIFAQNEHLAGKVTLFDGNIDLFSRCIKVDQFFIMEKILLYFVLRMLVCTQQTSADENFVDTVRVVRNLIYLVRQRKHTSIEPNFRSKDLPNQLVDLLKLVKRDGNIYQLLNEGIDLTKFKDGLAYELEKATLILKNPELKSSIHELEDQPDLKGAIFNLNLQINAEELPLFAKSFNEIWSDNHSSLIVRSLLSTGDYGLYIGGGALGERYFFGNENRWITILTNSKGDNSTKIGEILPHFLQLYNRSEGTTSKEKLNVIITKYLGNNTKRDWRYYFIKYPQMTSGNNLFAWLNDYELRRQNENSLRGWHINPYVRAVADIIKDDNICNPGLCYSTGTDRSPLRLKNKMNLHPGKDGWRIQMPEGEMLSEELIEKYSLTLIPDSNNYKLLENDTFDRIEIAVAFAKEPVVDMQPVA